MYVCYLVQVYCKFLRNQFRTFLKGNLNKEHRVVLRVGRPARLRLGAAPAALRPISQCWMSLLDTASL